MCILHVSQQQGYLQKQYILTILTVTAVLSCRWAQWLAGLDFLPTLPAGLVVQKESHHNAAQQGLKQYRREKRALHVMRTLVQRAEKAQGLQ